MKFIEHLEVFDRFIHTLVSVGPNLFRTNVFQDCFGLSRVVPEVVLMGDAFLVFDLYSFTVVVKDTSLGRRCGPLDLSVVRMSWGKDSKRGVRS
jgi:hypothetical protein